MTVFIYQSFIYKFWNIHHAIHIYKRIATHKYNRRPSPIIFKFRIATFKNVELHKISRTEVGVRKDEK